MRTSKPDLKYDFEKCSKLYPTNILKSYVHDEQNCETPECHPKGAGFKEPGQVGKS